MRTNFQMEYQNITMIAGNTVSFNVECYDDRGNTIEVVSADMVAKKDASSDVELFHKSLTDGIAQSSSGLLTVRIAPEDTRDAVGNYFYAFQVGIDNDIYTLMTGTLSIEQNVCE